MRSLKECYEIAKRYHHYWVGGNNTEYMCVAAGHAAVDGALSDAEAALVEQDAMSLVKAHDPLAVSLSYALRDVHKESPADHDTVKAYWDRYIDSMENQDDKGAIMRNIADKYNLQFVDIRLSTTESIDSIGLPRLNDD